MTKLQKAVLAVEMDPTLPVLKVVQALAIERRHIPGIKMVVAHRWARVSRFHLQGVR